MICEFIQLALYFLFYGTVLFLFPCLLWKFFPRGKIGDYHKRYVLITGCDSGFGKETAIRLDQIGFHVFATCLTREGEESLKAVCNDRLETLRLDVTKPEMIQDVYKQVKATIPQGIGLWGLVNNAGIVVWAPIEWQSLEHFKRTADVNLWGVIRMTKTFLPLIKQARGRVVNFSSMSGRVSLPVSGSYNITKYGVEAFSDTLRREMRPWGVGVAIIEPGAFKTSITNGAAFERSLDKLWNQLSDEMKKEYGEDITQRYAKFLNRENSSYPSPHLYKVANGVVDALTSLCPHTRYVIGIDAKVLTSLAQVLPTFLMDNFINLCYKDIAPRPTVNYNE